MAKHLSSTESTLQRPPLCAEAPVLRSLLPLMAGIALAGTGSQALIGMALIVAVLFLWRDPPRIIPLSLLAGLSLGLMDADRPDPSWTDRPPRESRLQLRIDETFNVRKPGRISGIGTLLHADLPVDTVKGRPAAFYLESGPLGNAPPAIGQVLECRAVLTYLPQLDSHDGYQLYLLRRDIFLSLNQGTVLQLRKAAPPAERFRQRLFRASEAVLSYGSREPGDPGHVLASMLLGNRSLLTDERIALYRQTGSYHLFAVSGLHVGSVALCLLFLGRLTRLPRGYLLVPVLLGTWGYVWLTGSSPSAVRAGIMITCLSLSRSLLRQPHLFPALALSAWLVLLWQPSQLFHLGFQLSYGVVTSIILIGLPLAQAIRNRINRRALLISGTARYRRILVKHLITLSDLVCVSLSAGLASMPLIIQHFGLFTPGGLIFGMLLNPLATLSVMTGCVALLLTPLAGVPFAGWVSLASWPLIRLMEWLLQLCLLIPGGVSSRSWPWAPTGTCLLTVTLLIAWLLQRARMRAAPLPALTYLIPFAIILGALTLTTVDA